MAKIPLDELGEYIMPYYKSGGGILLYTADGIYDAYMSSPWDTGFDDCAYSLKNRSSRELAG